MSELVASYRDLAGKSALVTGGATGIGAAIVAAFAGQGAKVGFIDVDVTAAEALVAELAQSTPRPLFFRACDVTDLDALAQTLADLIAVLGGVDILVNNAASDDRHAVDTVTPTYWRNRLAVNLDHQFFAAQAVLPSMRARGGGAIVNLGSVSWQLKLRDLVVYQTAKAGIEGLTRALARDLGGDNIRVNAVLPGAVDTPRQRRWLGDAEVDALLSDQCLRHRVQPTDVAEMVLFLASDASRACTAQAYVVDAGLI